MENRAFGEYTRSASFTMTLSKRQIEALLLITTGYYTERAILAPYQALARRGLIVWNDGKIEATKAGEIMADLLAEAGWALNMHNGLWCGLDTPTGKVM